MFKVLPKWRIFAHCSPASLNYLDTEISHFQQNFMNFDLKQKQIQIRRDLQILLYNIFPFLPLKFLEPGVKTFPCLTFIFDFGNKIRCTMKINRRLKNTIFELYYILELKKLLGSFLKPVWLDLQELRAWD